MTKEKALESFIGPLVASILTLAASGFFAEKAEPLEKRIASLEITRAERDVQQVEISRKIDDLKVDFAKRFDKIELKLEGRR